MLVICYILYIGGSIGVGTCTIKNNLSVYIFYCNTKTILYKKQNVCLISFFSVGAQSILKGTHVFTDCFGPSVY